MPLFNARLIEKNVKNPKPLPTEHEAVLTAWAENLAKGIYDSETKNDGQFIQRILWMCWAIPKAHMAAFGRCRKTSP